LGENYGLTALFRGGFGKVRVFCVVVCGEFVVGCVANVVAWDTFSDCEKYATDFEYFYSLYVVTLVRL
jgi:hypothetical protein